jgi:hypothetical protein
MAQFGWISTRGRAVALILAIGTGALGAGVARSLAPASAAGAPAPITLSTTTPTVVLNHAANLTARVSGTTGSVTFFLDGAQIPTTMGGTKNLSGGKNSVNASFAMNSIGDHTFTARYNVGAMPMSAPVTVHVVNAGANQAAVSVTSNIGNSIPSGTALVLTAHVSGTPVPTGVVSFSDGAVSLGANRNLTNGAVSLNVSSLPLGTNTITASYSGDPTYAPATGTVTITVTPTSNDKWLQHMYTDMIGSQDPSGEAFWSSQLNKGLPRYNAAYAFTQSQGYLMNLVSRQYLAEMGRPVDGPGGNFWVGQLQKGLAPEGFAASLVGSDEMFNSPTYGQSNIDTYISRVYQSMLGRNEDPAGAAFWHDFLISGGPRWKLTLDFAYSPEWASITVTRMYAQFHLGTPDSGSLNYWAGRLLSGMTDYELAANLASSPQYYGWTQAN